MLKNIKLHIDSDNEAQTQLESELADKMAVTKRENLNAFQRYIPSLLPLVQHFKAQRFSITCNKFGEVNIVDIGLGRVLYGFHPEQEINAHVECFLSHSHYVKLSAAETSPKQVADTEERYTEQELAGTIELDELPTKRLFSSLSPLPEEVPCVVVLGCGLGLHIKTILERSKVKYLLVYEPELEYFQSSCAVGPWKDIFELARNNNTQLFLQMGKDGRDLLGDMEELQAHDPIDGFYLYQHYNHPIFNSISKQLMMHSWQSLKNKGISFNLNENFLEYCPKWTTASDVTKYQSAKTKQNVLEKNLVALKKYLPDIYAEFQDYQPKLWLPIVTSTGEINIVKKDTLVSWYGDSPRQECHVNFENFSSQPNRDGLILGYNGVKLAHYEHYKFVKKTEQLLQEVEETQGALPEEIESIIIFGIGVGYQLESLFKHHKLQKVFLCEPNRDFFYASLFAIDWQAILSAMDRGDSRLYINIGDDGTSLFKDLLGQFYTIGPYLLNNTYFYQSYYNSSLNSAIAQLREQLRIVISMGEYFDHAYYGISHTKQALADELSFMVSKPNNKLEYSDKDIPVFLIGNGPSLDNSIDVIKEWQEQAILVTCGTSLQVMHRHQIVPDFHAEIEQNRTTFDWASLIGDPDYLKKISILSCNGLHPDTYKLYKDVYLVFKEGESSTVSTFEVIKESDYEVLKFAFPTVGNLAVNVFSQLGFHNIYLIGIDLGFIDNKHHHSKASGYYIDNGEELYDYSEANNVSISVPGNFRATVQTKHEFKLAKEIMEQTLLNKSKQITVYNCSDGAKIHGSIPLRLDNIISTTSAQQKASTIDNVKKRAFSKLDGPEFIKKYENKFGFERLQIDLEIFSKLINRDVKDHKAAQHLVKAQKELLFHSYKAGNSLLFYYLYGTVNYANALFVKLLGDKDKEIKDTRFPEALDDWRQCFKAVKKSLSTPDAFFDTSNFQIDKREKRFNKLVSRGKSLLVVTNSTAFAKSILYQLSFLHWELDAHICNYDSIAEKHSKQWDFVIYQQNESLGAQAQYQQVLDGQNLPLTGNLYTLAIVTSSNVAQARALAKLNTDVVFLMNEASDATILESPWYCDEIMSANYALLATIQCHDCNVILPNYYVRESFNAYEDVEHLFFPIESSDYLYKFSSYVTVVFEEKEHTSVKKPTPNGTRGAPVLGEFDIKQRLSKIWADASYDRWLLQCVNEIPYLVNDKPLREEMRF